MPDGVVIQLRSVVEELIEFRERLFFGMAVLGVAVEAV
jgi:hypothetical protein